MIEQKSGIRALGARVHMFVHPSVREPFTSLFKDVLECTILERDFGLAHPILFVPFPDGSGFSVEFNEHAPQEPLDEGRFHGTWIEFRVDNVPQWQEKLRKAGVEEWGHPGSAHRYFRAPGGQVFRLLELDYKGP